MYLFIILILNLIHPSFSYVFSIHPSTNPKKKKLNRSSHLIPRILFSCCEMVGFRVIKSNRKLFFIYLLKQKYLSTKETIWCQSVWYIINYQLIYLSLLDTSHINIKITDMGAVISYFELCWSHPNIVDGTKWEYKSTSYQNSVSYQKDLNF